MAFAKIGHRRARSGPRRQGPQLSPRPLTRRDFSATSFSRPLRQLRPGGGWPASRRRSPSAERGIRFEDDLGALQSQGLKVRAGAR